MSNTKHTQGELWRDEEGFLAIGSGDRYRTFADLDCNDLDIDEREANKDRVIKAWNSHDELVNACERSLLYLSYKYPKESDILAELKSVIEKATT